MDLYFRLNVVNIHLPALRNRTFSFNDFSAVPTGQSRSVRTPWTWSWPMIGQEIARQIRMAAATRGLRI